MEGRQVTDKKERFLAWLNDAYGMEKALEEVLERHASDAEGNATVQSRLREHLNETRQQADTVRGCIESLGGTVSGSKEFFAKLTGSLQGMANRPASDTMVKNALADYAAEHFEIASYRALITTAEELQERDIVIKLEQILRQEEAMAEFLADQLPHAVTTQLAHDQSA